MMKHFFLKRGFTLVEILVVVVLLSFLTAGTYSAFLTGQSVWLTTENTIELQENLGRSLDRIAAELRQSGHDGQGAFQIFVDDGEGEYKSDIIRFSIPIICQNQANLVDANGDTAHWGAPLTWGCAEASCMDANNNCDTVEYKYIQYLLTAQHQLLRRVLDYSQAIVHEDVIAEGMIDLQLEANVKQPLVTLRLTAQKQTAAQKNITQSSESKIYLRNAR